MALFEAIEETETVIIIVAIGVGIYFLTQWKLPDGTPITDKISQWFKDVWPQGVSPNVPPPGTQQPMTGGQTTGTTVYGTQWNVSPSGAMTIYDTENTPPVLIGPNEGIGPNAETISQLVAKGWSYNDIATFFVMAT